ncbi:MAG: SGNH/GDSL hydrolase family protein [Candidatus Omnitrophica bacterium]|nr:SGNH/GDSL hydrolase family protein [Candidatus Omnitrophota bacterium]
MKKRLTIVGFNIIAISLGAGIGIVLAEGLIRIAMPNYAFYQRTYPGKFANKDSRQVRYDKDLGWVFKKSAELEGIKYSINKQGFRDPRDFEDKRTIKKNRIVILGDSFVFGLCVNEELSLPSLIQQKLGDSYEVFNLGMSGYGIDQMYITYKKYAPVINPDIVILAFISDDIQRVTESYRNIEKFNKPSFDLKNGNLVSRNRNDLNMLDYISQKSILLNMIYARIYRRYLGHKICEKIFLELIKETREHNEKLIVVKYPCRDDIEKSKKFITEIIRSRIFGFENIFKDTPAVYMDCPPAILKLSEKEYKKFFLSDGHPSGEGNKLMAEYITTNYHFDLAQSK